MIVTFSIKSKPLIWYDITKKEKYHISFNYLPIMGYQHQEIIMQIMFHFSIFCGKVFPQEEALKDILPKLLNLKRRFKKKFPEISMDVDTDLIDIETDLILPASWNL